MSGNLRKVVSSTFVLVCRVRVGPLLVLLLLCFSSYLPLDSATPTDVTAQQSELSSFEWMNIDPAPPDSTSRPSVSYARRGSVILARGSIFQSFEAHVGPEEDNLTKDGGREREPILLKDIIKVANKDLVITQSLRVAIVETASSFGLNVVDEDTTGSKELNLDRLPQHVSKKNSYRMVRDKAKLKRPSELARVDTATKRYGGKQRARVREANRKQAISVSHPILPFFYACKPIK